MPTFILPLVFNTHFQVRVSAVLTNGPFLLNLDCDHYINNSKALREAMCFLMDPNLGKHVCYVQFPQRFDGIDRNDRYANRNTVFFDVSLTSSNLSDGFFCVHLCYWMVLIVFTCVMCLMSLWLDKTFDICLKLFVIFLLNIFLIIYLSS